MSGDIIGNTPCVVPNWGMTELYVKSNGKYLKRYQMNGTLVDSIPGSVIGTGSNAMRYFEVSGKKYLSVYTYGSGNEFVRTVDITSGLASATFIGASPTLGSTSNGNGTGDVALKVNGDNTVNVYVLGTNNGIGAYKVNPANYGTADRFYLVSRKAGNLVWILNGATGDSLGRLDTTGLAAIASGTLGINDADVSTDGVIYACNLTANATTSAFKVYKWKDESSTPTLAFSYTGLAYRFGDKFTVTGSTANSTVAIWAVSAGNPKVVKFTTADSGKTFTPNEITLTGFFPTGAAGPSVCPNLTGTEFYVKAGGDYVKHYQANGTFIDSLSGGVVGTGANAIRYFELSTKKFLAVFTYGGGNEFARIVEVTNGLPLAVSLGTTPSLGTNANGNGTGDVSLKMNGDGTANVSVLSTNNGIGTYTFTPPAKVANPTFAPVAGTYYAPFKMVLSTTTLNAKIYYTLSGATPDSISGTLYADSVAISDTLTTVKAIAYANGMTPSDIVTAVYQIIVVPASTPLYTVWAKTQAAGTLPRSWIPSGNYERGAAYGKVGGNDRWYVVARSGGPHIEVYSAMKGDSVRSLWPTASVTGGTFPLNFVGVSQDGVILVCNMTTDVSSSAFKVYSLNTEDSIRTAVINYTNGSLTSGRMGDAISVYGKASDNTLTIFAAVSGKDKVVKFTTADNGATFTPTVITLSNGVLGTVPSVALASDNTLYVKSYGKQVYHYTAAGTLVDSLTSAVIGTDVTNIKYYERLSKKYLLCYSPNDGLPYTDERLTLVDITDPVVPYPAFTAPSIGNVANGNGTGAVDLMSLPGNDFVVFILGTNNGIAAYTNNPSIAVTTLDTLFYGTTKNLLKNPYGPGYICGTNGYGDLGKYQRFDFANGDKLYGFTFFFGYKSIVGSPDTIKLVVKPKTGGGAPGATVASSIITTDQIDLTNGNTVLLNTPITVTGPMFIGFEFKTTWNDTVAVYSDKNGEGDNAVRVWEMFNDSTYNDFNGILLPSFSWNIDVDLWIAAHYKKNITTSVTNVGTVPQKYSLEQNYPNPFNPTTTIQFNLPMGSRVTLDVYNLLGQRVAELVDGQLQAGTHTVLFNANRFSTGVYFYRIEAKGVDGTQFRTVKKLLLLK
jgi:hypothetical protein